MSQLLAVEGLELDDSYSWSLLLWGLFPIVVAFYGSWRLYRSIVRCKEPETEANASLSEEARQRLEAAVFFRECGLNEANSEVLSSFMSLATRNGQAAELLLATFVSQHPELISGQSCRKMKDVLKKAANHWRDQEKRVLDAASRSAYVALCEAELKQEEEEDEEILRKIGV